MKKERAAFFCNIAAAVLVTAVLVSAAPRISAVGAVGQRVAAVFSPTYFSNKINTEFTTIKSAQTTHTKTTATREAQAMHPISGKDSDPYAHITETPADVSKLMQQEKSDRQPKAGGQNQRGELPGRGDDLVFRFAGNSEQDPRFVLSSGHRGTP